MKKILVIAALAGFAVSPAGAYYVGSIGFPFGRGGSALEVLYDTGSREVEPSNGGRDFDMDSDRLYIQYTRGLGDGLEFFGRGMPQTGEITFEDDSSQFDVWGLGGGVRWAPRQRGRTKFGMQVSFDWNQGDDSNSRTDIDVKEILFAGGLSSRVNRNVDVYGGVSFLKSDVTVDPPAGQSWDIENSNTFGVFGGLDLKPSKKFTVGVELHLINETIFAFTGRLKF